MYILDEVDAALDLSHTQVDMAARSTKGCFITQSCLSRLAPKEVRLA